MEAEGDSAGCGRIESKCCNFCGFDHPPYTCYRSVKSNIQPFSSAGGARQISPVLKILFESADVFIFIDK